MTETKQKAHYNAPAAACAAAVLLTLARAEGPLSLAELVERTAHTRSLIYRTLKTLAESSFVDEAGAGNNSGGSLYRLGASAAEIGGAYQAGVPFTQSLRAANRGLSSKTGETVSIGTLVGTDVLYLLREEGPYSVLAVSQVGKRLPAHATAVGKALLAQLNENEVRALYGDGNNALRAFTDSTITDLGSLLAELEQIRLRGYATEKSELVQNRCCIGVSIPIEDGTNIGLSLSSAENRFNTEFDFLTMQVLITKNALLTETRNRSSLGGSTSVSDSLLGLASLSNS